MTLYDYDPKPYRRIRPLFIGFVIRWLPKAPLNQRRLKVKWRHLRPYVGRREFAMALGMLAAVIVAITALRNLAVMRISLFSFVWGLPELVRGGGVDAVSVSKSSAGGGWYLPWWQAFPATVGTLAIGSLLFNQLPWLAAREEQDFREGAENWNGAERLRSCVVFGLAHLGNFWYPLAAITALAVGGGIFMWIYLDEHRRHWDREAAVLRATALHALYNSMAVALLVAILLAEFWL